MEFEKVVRPLVDAFVQALQVALRAQLEARLLGSAAPIPGRRRRPVARMPPDAPAAGTYSAGATGPLPRPEPPSPVPRPPTAGASRTDPTIERVLAFVADNQDRMGEDGEPLRIQPTLIASHLGLAPPLAKAVVEHLVSTRILERRGAGRTAYYVRVVS